MVIELRPKRPKYDKEKYIAEQKTKTDEMNQTIKNLAETWQNQPEDIADFIRFKQRFYRYSINNSIIIYAQNENASYVGSYNSFKEKGYSVNAGQHGLKIFVPVEVTLFRDGDEWKQVSGATKEQKEKIKSGELESRKDIRFKLGTVFDISQTNCPLEDYPKLLGMGYNSNQHAKLYQGLKKFCKTLDIPVEEKDLTSVTLRGYYSPASNSITINESLGDTQKLSTLSHELGHALLHRQADAKSVTQKELEADALSLMLESNFGIEPTVARKNHLAEHYRAYKETLETQAGKPTSALESIDTVLENVSRVYADYQERVNDCIRKELEHTASERNETHTQLLNTIETILDDDNNAVLYDKSPESEAAQLIKAAQHKDHKYPIYTFQRWDIIAVRIVLDDGLKHERLFLVSDSVPVLGISEGYNLTSANSGGIRKLQYITNVPLLPNENNRLTMPSVIKMNCIYPFYDTQGHLVGHLTQDEAMIVGEYDNLYKKYGLQQYDAQLNLRQDDRLQYELYKATARNDAETLLRLAHCGADVNDDRNQGFTPLHQAAAFGAIDAARALLERGVYVDARDGRDYTPLRYAADCGSEKTVELLLHHGADAKIAGLENTEENTEDLTQNRHTGRHR